MDRFAGISRVNSHATDVTRNPDGTFTTAVFPDSVVTVTKTATDTWKMSGMFCEGDMCISRDIIHSVAGTCYTQDTRVTHINSASSTRLSTRITDNTGDPIIERSVISVPTNGRLNFNVSITNNGLMTNTLTFTEDLSGGSTSSSTSSSSAASTAASTASSTATSTTGM